MMNDDEHGVNSWEMVVNLTELTAGKRSWLCLQRSLWSVKMHQGDAERKQITEELKRWTRRNERCKWVEIEVTPREPPLELYDRVAILLDLEVRDMREQGRGGLPGTARGTEMPMRIKRLNVTKIGMVDYDD